MNIELLEKSYVDGCQNCASEDAKELIEKGFLSVKARSGEDKRLMVEITDLGKDYYIKTKLAENIDTKYYYNIYTDGVVYSKHRSSIKFEPHYPFSKLMVNDFFFVPCDTDEQKSVVRSNVNIANKKYGTLIGKRPYGDAEIDKYEYARKFVSRSIEKNETCGLNFIAPCDGVIVMRIEL